MSRWSREKRPGTFWIRKKNKKLVPLLWTKRKKIKGNEVEKRVYKKYEKEPILDNPERLRNIWKTTYLIKLHMLFINRSAYIAPCLVLLCYVLPQHSSFFHVNTIAKKWIPVTVHIIPPYFPSGVNNTYQFRKFSITKFTHEHAWLF